MKEEFESLESVSDMLAYLVENNKESMQTPAIPRFTEELNILNVQMFLKLFDRYKKLNEKQKDELSQCSDFYNDSENDPITQQSALAHVIELLFPEDVKPEKEIIRKNESKVYQTPCEDCQGGPTHLVVFKTDNRTEEHFLCEDCEEAAHAEDGDE